MDVVAQARSASKHSGTSLLQQLRESFRLRFGDSALGFSEYFAYRLYDRRAVARSNIDTFASVALMQQLWEALNPRKWWLMASDKVVFHTIMIAAGFRQPEIFAYLERSGRRAPGIATVSDASELLDRICDTNRFPMFAKPADGMQSLGALGLAGIDSDNLGFNLTNGSVLSFDKFVETLQPFRSYIVQELIRSDESIHDVTGDTLSTLRLVILIGDSGPEIFRARWKIPVRGNMADNFWRPGNLLADLDEVTGKVRSLIRSTDDAFAPVTVNSTYGQRFIGSAVPRYADAVALCLDASRLFSKLTFQSWDVALTSEGPMLLELNHNGDIELLQMGASVGILDEQLRGLLKSKDVVLTNHRTRWIKSTFRSGRNEQ